MRKALTGLVLAVGLTGCFGEALLGAGSDTGSPVRPGEQTPGTPGGPGGGGGGGPGSVFTPGCGAECDAPGLSTRAARLTHAQWSNTVRDLLKIAAPTALVSSFTADSRAGNFDTNTTTLVVGNTLWSDYQRAAESLAVTATNTDADLAKLLPANLPSSGAERTAAFLRSLGLRAYRRPVTDAELSRLTTLFNRGTELTGVTDPFRAGARIVLQALLQSPYFLYRLEASQEADADGLVPLTPYEKATRLSYALWNTMPDDALFEAAASGRLDTEDGVREEARRLLADARAKPVIGRFHEQLFELDLFHQVVRSTNLFPVTANLGASLHAEAERFIDDVVNTRQEGFKELLTRTNTFVNAELAGLYGLSGTYGTDFRAAELDPAQRSGLLTRLGFMTYYGHNGDSDPIRRGVFINLRLLCTNLPPPPDNVTPLPAVTEGTMREIVTSHTGAGTCGASCHGAFINPVGFAFENYDGVGRYRTQDNGKPVNAADAFVLKNGDTLTYANALEFSQKLAETEQAHACYTQQWAEYLFGRHILQTDTHLVSRLGTASRDGLSARDVVLDIVTSRAFLNRAAEAP